MSQCLDLTQGAILHTGQSSAQRMPEPKGCLSLKEADIMHSEKQSLHFGMSPIEMATMRQDAWHPLTASPVMYTG